MKEKWNPVDPRWFEGKTLKELQERLKEAQEFCNNHPQFQHGWHNLYREELMKRIAEMIGNRKK